MRGGSGSQVGYLMESSGIFCPGQSKHEMKERISTEVRAEYASSGQSLSSRELFHELGARMPIVSYSTMHSYADVWKQAINFAKEELGIKDIEKFDSGTVARFLESKIEVGVSRSTFDTYAGAMQKMELALNMYSEKFQKGNQYDFGLRPDAEIRQRAGAELSENISSRAYDRPNELIGNLDGRSQIVANIQYEGGARVTEAFSIRAENLLGDNKLMLDNCKGGLDRIVSVSAETYSSLRSYLANNDGKILQSGERLRHAAQNYRYEIKHAAANTGQSYNGSHGLRWNYAQESYSKHIKGGCSPEQSLSRVSAELGHRRSDITLHYLK